MLSEAKLKTIREVLERDFALSELTSSRDVYTRRDGAWYSGTGAIETKPRRVSKLERALGSASTVIQGSGTLLLPIPEREAVAVFRLVETQEGNRRKQIQRVEQAAQAALRV